MDDELLEEMDAHCVRTGNLVPRQAAHAVGAWHETFQCWLVRGGESIETIVLSERSPTKKTFPGYLEATASGHLTEGESVSDGVRELEEELGITVPFEALTPVGVLPQVCDWFMEDGTKHQVREHANVHLLAYGHDLRSIVFDRNEIDALVEIGVPDFVRLIQGSVDQVCMTRFDGESLELVDVSMARLVPTSDRYWAALIQCLQRDK